MKSVHMMSSCDTADRQEPYESVGNWVLDSCQTKDTSLIDVGFCQSKEYSLKLPLSAHVS